MSPMELKTDDAECHKINVIVHLLYAGRNKTSAFSILFFTDKSYIVFFRIVKKQPVDKFLYRRKRSKHLN